MPGFRVISDIHEIKIPAGWANAAKFNSEDKVVTEKGEIATSEYKGRQYQLVSKIERYFSVGERIGRGFLAVAALVLTVGLAILCPVIRPMIRKLFTAEKATIRYGILITPSTGSGGETKKEDQSNSIDGIQKTSAVKDVLLNPSKESPLKEKVIVEKASEEADTDKLMFDKYIDLYGEEEGTKKANKVLAKKTKVLKAQTAETKNVKRAQKEIKQLFHSIDSGKLQTVQTPPNFNLASRSDFFKLAKSEAYKTDPPVLSRSHFVPDTYVQHLMKNKKNSALGVKYVEGDAITNMEGALHTFLTPLCKANLSGDYAWKGGHSIDLFGGNQVRQVILSAAIQPDFEYGNVMASLIGVGEESVKGEALPDDFVIPSPEDKKDTVKRLAYEKQLRKHMIYHLTAEHCLPALDDLVVVNSYHDAKLHLQLMVDKPEYVNAIKGYFFINPNGGVSSLEMLYNSYIQQLTNEFKVLEEAAPQGYVYTIDPPSIFAQTLGSANLLNRLQILAFKKLHDDGLFKNLKCIGFNDYQDKKALSLLQAALPGIEVVSKSEALKKMDGYALVVHNNSDAFGQNIETEGPSSLDGVLGSYSDAALVLERSRSDLCSIIV